MNLYLPQHATERSYYEAVWAAANPAGVPELAGGQVAEFLSKSSVDKGILRQIW